MKRIAIICFSLVYLMGCSNPQPAVSNDKVAPVEKKQELTVASHTTENQLPANSKKSVNSASPASPEEGSPMAKPVDVAEMTKKIETAQSAFKKNEKDEKAKAELATAYFERAFALTKAAQYRAALGDFRKGLKLDSANQEAKDMHDQIINIFESIGREPPKEGEEPAAMPIK